MRRLLLALAVISILAAPTSGFAQSATPGNSFSLTNPWVVGGAIAGVVAINAATGGAMLAPMIGPAASNMIGGAWLGPMALSAAARQALCRTTTLVAGAAVGAGLGYWIGS